MIDLTSTRPVVVLDASVLFSIRATNLVLEIATHHLFQPRWSDLIHDEWTRNLLVKNPTVDAAKFAKRKAGMDTYFPDARVTGFESLIPSLTLPDANDRHVLAAAIAARADVIVTFNMRHFPQPLLDPYQVTSTHPDAFLMDVLDADPVAVVAAAQTVRRRLNAPPQTADQFIQALTNAGLRRFSTELARHKDQL